MLTKIRLLIQKHWDIISYLIFGVLTTVVNYLIYLPLYNLAHLSAALSNAVAWAGAVIFAFLTNKPFVFKSNDWSAHTVLRELMRFVGVRLGSGFAETVIIFATVDLLGLDGNVMKLITSVMVVIMNYLTSKLFVFKKK